ncbi:hypothetical protein PG994_001686 [Apiospora phragmitis]|uniref:Uncharacterized protein n=1 Tax=Apiospora phragmitis TaxID=2905665 RepID=A0ABR1WUC8_9PEZI
MANPNNIDPPFLPVGNEQLFIPPHLTQQTYPLPVWDGVPLGPALVPYWDAPLPFAELEVRQGNTRKVNLNHAQCRRMESFLETLSLLPASIFGPPANFYFKESTISEALNAYNLHARSRECQPWAFFHYRGLNSTILVPHNPPANFDWTDLRRRTVLRYGATGGQLGGDLSEPWPSVTRPVNRWRFLPNYKHYRLMCWIHRHEHIRPEDGEDDEDDEDFTPEDVVYTMSVWDRENDLIYFHDPWRDQNSAARFADIQTFWANIRPYTYEGAGLPAVPPANIRHVRYNSLGQMAATTHNPMRPKFSQISCVAIAVWLMNHIDYTTDLIPPDRPDILDGSHPLLFPALFLCTFRTLREALAASNRLTSGNSQETQDYVMGKFLITPLNLDMVHHMRRILRQAYGRNLADPESWIVSSIAWRLY